MGGASTDTWHLDDFQMPGEARIDYVRRCLGSTNATPPERPANFDTMIHHSDEAWVELSERIEVLLEYFDRHRVYLPAEKWALLHEMATCKDVLDKFLDPLLAFICTAAEFCDALPHMRYRINVL